MSGMGLSTNLAVRTRLNTPCVEWAYLRASRSDLVSDALHGHRLPLQGPI